MKHSSNAQYLTLKFCFSCHKLQDYREKLRLKLICFVIKINPLDFSSIVVAVEIRIERTWNDELRDKASPTYRDLASLIENEVRNK